MAATSALHTAGLVTSAPAARLAQTAMVAKNGITPRTGVVFAGNQALLTATASTSPMQVKVSPLHFVGSKADAQGTYWGANDGDYLLTIGAAPGSGSRTDVVYIMQQDSNAGTTSPDATTAPLIAATSGALPAGAVRVGSVVVPAGVTKLTDAGVVVTTDCQWTAAAGAPIPVRNTTERGTLTPYVGMLCQRLDKGGLVQRYDGTAWRGQRQLAKTFTVASLGSGGAVNVNHGCDFTPAIVIPNDVNAGAATGGMAYHIGTQSITSTTMQFVCHKYDGTYLPSGTALTIHAVMFEAET